MRKKWEVSKLGLSFVPSGRKLAFHISPLGVTAAFDSCNYLSISSGCCCFCCFCCCWILRGFFIVVIAAGFYQEQKAGIKILAAYSRQI